MVAFATIRTNQKAVPRITNAKQTISQGQTTRVNKLPLIAFTAIHTHAQVQITQTTFTMDAKTIKNIETKYNSAEITEQTTRWKKIVKPGIYRMTGGRWKRYHELKFLRNERKVIEERLQLLINNWPQEDLRQKTGTQNKGGFQPQTGHSEQWTVDLFWDMNQPTPV